jgi:hypothetical protein
VRGRRPSPLDDSGASRTGRRSSIYAACKGSGRSATGPSRAHGKRWRRRIRIWSGSDAGQMCTSHHAGAVDAAPQVRLLPDNVRTPAAVAELVDAQASGACALRGVEVQVLSAACLQIDTLLANLGEGGRRMLEASRTAAARCLTAIEPADGSPSRRPSTASRCARRSSAPRSGCGHRAICITDERWLRTVPATGTAPPRSMKCAGAVWPQQAEHLAARHFEADAAHSLHLAAGLAQTAHLDACPRVPGWVDLMRDGECEAPLA